MPLQSCGAWPSQALQWWGQFLTAWPLTQGQTFLGEAKSQRPEGWRCRMGASGCLNQGASTSWHRGCLEFLSSEAACIHTPQAGKHELPPPSLSGLRSLDSSTCSECTPGPTGTSMKLIPAPSNGQMSLPILRIQQERESNVSPLIQEHSGKTQDFTGPAQPCDKVPRIKKSWVSATAEVAGEPQSTNSTIIYCTGCIKLNT